jgi:hypothetical protein
VRCLEPGEEAGFQTWRAESTLRRFCAGEPEMENRRSPLENIEEGSE